MSNKQLFHNKAGIAYVFIVLLSVVKWTVYESQEACSWDTLISVPHVCEEQKVKLCECNLETFYLIFLFPQLYGHNGFKQCEHRDIKKKAVYLSSSRLRKYIVVLTLNRLSNVVKVYN